MTVKMIMPRLGETVTEGMVIEWRKKEGEPVEKDELIVEVSTDKVDSELPSPASGVLSKIEVKEGETVPVETELAVIEEGGREEGRKIGREEEEQEAAPEEKLTAPEKFEIGGAPISPVVRKLAEERGIDLSKIKGTGTGGRITKDDLLDYIVKAKPSERDEGRVTRDKIGGAAPPPAAEAPPKAEGEEVVELGHIRRLIAQHMVDSKRTSPHVTAIIEADMERIFSLRECYRGNFKKIEDFSLSYLPFFCVAVLEALKKYPTFNSTLEGDNLIIKHYVNLGISVAIEEGLIVPVIRDAGNRSMVEIARSIHDLATRARDKKLSPDEVKDGTFTVTAPGSLGSIIQTPIINQPQVAIISLEAVTQRVVPVDNAIGIRYMVFVPLSYDHRVNDGAQAAKFLSEVKYQLEERDFEKELSEYAAL